MGRFIANIQTVSVDGYRSCNGQLDQFVASLYDKDAALA